MTATERGGIVLRPAVADDAAALADVHVRAWQAAYPGLMPQDFLDGLDVGARTEGWRRAIDERADGSTVLVATVGGAPAGFVGFGAARDDDAEGIGEVVAINIDPLRWGGGIGSALLVAAHEGLAAAGYASAILWVVPGNARARRFYERHGWVDDGAERVITIGRERIELPEMRYARPLR